MVPKPVGAPVTAELGANCEVLKQGVFTALVQLCDTYPIGEAKIAPL